MVSVVIPTRDRAQSLRLALAGLEAQGATAPSFEVIVVDDGSADPASVDLACAGHLPRPIVLHQEWRGPAAARNRGVDAASADLLVFLGDDIVVAKGYLSAMVESFRRTGDGNAAIVGLTQYDRSSLPTPFGRWLEHSGLQFDYLAARPGVPCGFEFVYTSNLLVPRQLVLKAGGFDERLTYAALEDTELGYRLELGGLDVYYCPDAGATHVHLVGLKSTARRMVTVGKATAQLSLINPELYQRLFLEGRHQLRPAGAATRFGRYALARWAVRPADAVDRLGIPLPAGLYRRLMSAAHRHAISLAGAATTGPVALVSGYGELEGDGVRPLVALAVGLHARGVDLVVVMPAPGSLQEHLEAHGIELAVVQNFADLRHPMFGHGRPAAVHNLHNAAGRAAYVDRLRRYLSRRGVGLVHVNGLTGSSGALAAKALGLPLVWHVHEPRVLLEGAWGVRLLRALADEVIATSEYGRGMLLRAGVRPDRVVVVPDGEEGYVDGVRAAQTAAVDRILRLQQ